MLWLDEKEVTKYIESFEGLPHRMERLGEIDGVTYYDDSISDNMSVSNSCCRNVLKILELLLSVEWIEELIIRFFVIILKRIRR